MKHNTFERIYPKEFSKSKFDQDILRYHLERYQFACKEMKGKRGLDFACGVGYGTKILADALGRNGMCIGVDIDRLAINYARRHYRNKKTKFVVSDLFSFRSRYLFDFIVSLETIEHLENPKKFAKLLTGLIKPGGILVCSVPVTPSVDANPYHRHDFSESGFIKMMEGVGFTLKRKMIQIQPYSPFEVFSKKRNFRLEDTRRNILKYYWNNPGRLLARIYSTVRFGFANRYLVSSWILVAANLEKEK